MNLSRFFNQSFIPAAIVILAAFFPTILYIYRAESLRGTHIVGPLSITDEVLDIVIRNQVSIFGFILFLIAVLVIFFGLDRKSDSSSHDREEGSRSISHIDKKVGQSVVRGTSTWRNGSIWKLVITLVLLLLLFKAFLLLREGGPIPPTIGLSTPTVLRIEAEKTNLIVFVHGWSGDPDNTWKRFPELLLEDSRLSDFNVISVHYPTYMIRRNLNIRQLARWLADNYERNDLPSHHTNVFIFAHSMGGLISREMVLAAQLSHGRHPFRGLVEIAVPKQGANPSLLGTVFGVSAELAADMLPGSRFLETLRDDWNQLGSRPPTFCIASRQDLVVPFESAIALCDRYGALPHYDHQEIVKPTSRSDERYELPVSRLLTAFNPKLF